MANSLPVRAIDGSDAWVLYTPPTSTAPTNSVQPYARHTLWQRDLAQRVGPWHYTMKSAATHAGVRLVLVSQTRVIARFRVDERHQQPSGLLHGGFTALVAEEMGSVASVYNSPMMTAKKPAAASSASASAGARSDEAQGVVGISIQATHLSSARLGDMVVAVCTPVKGRGSVQVWQVLFYIDTDPDEPFGLPTADSANASGSVGKQALFYSTWQPKGKQLATCQLTAVARPPSKASKL